MNLVSHCIIRLFVALSFLQNTIVKPSDDLNNISRLALNGGEPIGGKSYRTNPGIPGVSMALPMPRSTGECAGLQAEPDWPKKTPLTIGGVCCCRWGV